MTIRLILTDIEGTTSSISFVQDVLFPYAAQHLPSYVRTNQHTLADVLAATAALATEEGQQVDVNDTEGLIQVLLSWIANDKKATPLKTLQGLIWRAGYEQGDYQAHMYPDATQALQAWHDKGIPLYVYSSGSVGAQKLFFAYSQDGDLLPLFSGHFDTQVGAKQEVSAYQRIITELQQQHSVKPDEVLFLSDIEAELAAAQDAGLSTAWLVREQPLPHKPVHPAVASFHELATIYPELAY